jgi:S-DNA-T family DNA segregation ATPase FtsK/SpoIIIE
VASTEEGARDDLTLLAEAMATAVRHRGRPAPARPWLPPLPDCISADALACEAGRFEVRFGLTDDPARQAQFPAAHELSRGGSIGFVGGPRSGRSTALTTMLGQAARQLGPDELHLYLLDCAGRGLEPLAGLPHCGAALCRDDPRSATRLISRLADEVGARQRRLAELGVSSVAEAHLQGIAIPVMVLVIDGWEGLAGLSDDYDAGRTVDAVLRLLRDGSAVGLTVLVTGDRALLGIRIAPAISRKLVMALTDRSDYALAGLSPSVLPTRFRPGQAIDLADGLETQIAVLAADPSPAAQRTALHRIIANQPTVNGGPTISIRALPESASQAELREAEKAAAGVPDDDDLPASGARCLLGVGGDDATAVRCDLFEPHSRFLIAGPARSGRSTTALVIARQGLAAGLDILVAASRRSPLAHWAARHSVEMLRPDVDSGGKQLRTVALFDGDLLVVDDAELFNDTPAGDALLAVLNRAAAVVATCRVEDLMVSFRGLAAQLRRDRTGLLLQPGPADGELLGIRPSAHRAVAVPGRGLLITDEIRRTAPDGCHLQVAI